MYIYIYIYIVRMPPRSVLVGRDIHTHARAQGYLYSKSADQIDTAGSL